MDDPDLSRITETYNRHRSRAAECCKRIYSLDSDSSPNLPLAEALLWLQ